MKNERGELRSRRRSARGCPCRILNVHRGDRGVTAIVAARARDIAGQ
jgi:hypothetical protein